jgi:hypothetical protein
MGSKAMHKRTRTFFNMLGLFLFAMLIPAVPTSGGLQAAESLDEAVEELAGGLAANTDLGAGSARMKVAITAFPHTDQTTSELSLFLVDALSTRMLMAPDGKFVVIERAKLREALRETQLSEQGVFDTGGAITELGKFLGADALVIGSITVVGDRVLLNARLVRPATVETIGGAEAWLPLTPTIQKMVERRLYVADPLQDSSGARSGIWVGRGACGDSAFSVAIAMVWSGDDTIQALQTYFPDPSGPALEPGILEMEGRFNPATNEVTLSPGPWLHHPKGDSAAGIKGQLDPARNVIEGQYLAENCGKISLLKR